MTQVVTEHTDLDRLAERVERAAALVQQLREDRQRLEGENQDLASKLSASERRHQGQDVVALLAEVQTLRKEQRAWESDRKDVASRIEVLVQKLERLEA